MHWRGDPLQEIANLRARISRVFEQRLRSAPRAPEVADSGEWAPRVDIYETDTSLVFEAELAGLSRDDIEVEVRGDTLIIKGRRAPVAGREYVRVERPQGLFYRSFAVGRPLRPDQIRVEYRDGVLSVFLAKPQAPEPNPVKVTIE